MCAIRHTGFVVGDEVSEIGTKFWRVRIKPSGCPHDGMKIPVATVRNDLALFKGLNVTFLIGTVDNERGERVARAMDVLPISG